MPPLVGRGGGLVCVSVGTGDLLSDRFDDKQSREFVDMPLTCHPTPSIIIFAFKSNEVKCLKLEFGPYGGTDPFGMFPLFLRRTADVLTPSHTVVFRRLLRLGSFPACGRQANVTTISKCHHLPLLPISKFPTDFHNSSVV